MIASAGSSLGKGILKAIGKGIGKDLGPEYEPWVWGGLALLLVAGFMTLVFLAARSESKRDKKAAKTKPVIEDHRAGKS